MARGFLPAKKWVEENIENQETKRSVSNASPRGAPKSAGEQVLLEFKTQ